MARMTALAGTLSVRCTETALRVGADAEADADGNVEVVSAPRGGRAAATGGRDVVRAGRSCRVSSSALDRPP
jgi:hypothetical protein